ncbi:MAG: alpha/beta fold hydrolase [Gemmatimonadales bacterium]
MRGWMIGGALAIGLASGCLDSRWSLSARAMKEATVRTGDVALFYRVIGTGPDTVIVVPGGPGRSMDYLGPAIGPLASAATWIIYDPRGTGRSRGPSGTAPLGLAADVADLEALRLALGIERVGLVGHNTGAAVAAHYAAQHPEVVRRLALISPYPISQGFVWAWHLLERDTARFRRGGLSYQTTRDSATAAAFCREFWFWYFQPVFVPPDLPAGSAGGTVCTGASSDLVDPERYQLSWLKTASGHDWRSSFGAVTAPTLVIEGVTGRPGHLFEVHADTWARAFADGRTAALRGGALLPWLSRPAEFQSILSQFLAGQWPAEAIRPGPADSATAGDR